MELQSVLLITLLSFRKAGTTRGCGHDSLSPACLTSIHLPLPTVSHCCAVLSCSVVADSLQHHGLLCQASLSIEILQARIQEWVAMPSSRGTFPTQGLNRGLPHCRQIPSHLSHQRSQEHWSRLSIPYSLPKFASPPGSCRGCGPIYSSRGWAFICLD